MKKETLHKHTNLIKTHQLSNFARHSNLIQHLLWTPKRLSVSRTVLHTTKSPFSPGARAEAFLQQFWKPLNCHDKRIPKLKQRKKNGNTNVTLKKCGEPNPRGVCYFLGLLPLNVMVRIAREVTRSQMQQKHCHTRISSSDHTKKFCFRWDILWGCDRVRKQIR